MAHEASYFEELGGAKTQLTLHRPNRILFGLLYRCDDPTCRRFSRERGCAARRHSLAIFLALADPAERQAAVDADYFVLDVEKDEVLSLIPTTQEPAAAELPTPVISFRGTAPVLRFPEATAMRATPDFGQSWHPAPRPIPPLSVTRQAPVRTAAPS